MTSGDGIPELRAIPVGGGHYCAGCPRLSESLWSVLEPEHFATLNAARQTRVFEAGQLLVAQGQPCDGIHCIESGEFALRRVDPAGNNIVLRLGGPGEAVGYRAFFSGQVHAASVEALTRTSSCFVPASTLRELLGKSTRLAGKFLTAAARELDEADETRIRQVFLPVRARFAHLLLCLRERHANVDSDGALVISLPLSRQDIAASLGTTPETVARTVGALQHDGVAEFRGRTVRVNDLDLLLDELEKVGLG